MNTGDRNLGNPQYEQAEIGIRATMEGMARDVGSRHAYANKRYSMLHAALLSCFADHIPGPISLTLFCQICVDLPTESEIVEMGHD